MKKLLYILAIAVVVISCRKYDTPPLTYPEEGTTITIDSLRQLYQAQGPTTFNYDLDLYGIVTMDENDGNIYKSVFLQDHTGAINVRMLNGGGVYQGDSVRIALNGCYLNQFGGVQQLDSVNSDWNIVKLSVDNYFPPEVLTIDQITTAKESQLIQLNNVQVVKWQLDDTYADKENLENGDVLIEDMNGNAINVRTSGYASFADEQVAQGSGSIILIVSHFNGEMQLLIRSYSEINMSGSRFIGLQLYKDFNDDNINSYGWTVYNESGSAPFDIWETSSAGGAPNPYAAASNFDGVNYAVDSWLISPSFDIASAPNPRLAFDNAYSYTGDPLELYISLDYVSGSPSTATWDNITSLANWSAGSFTWVNSGDIDLSPYQGSNVHIGFRYQGSSGDGSTWELDNIVIKG